MGVKLGRNRIHGIKSLIQDDCIQNTDMGFDFFDLVGSALRTERRNTVTGFDPELFRQWKILFQIFLD